MPRHNHDRRQSSRPQQSTGPERRPRTQARNVDEEALSLREAGESYSAIARLLELPRATAAHAAFTRALHHRTGSERADLEKRENDRLDQLETRIRTRDAADPDKVARRLAGVDVLRSSVK